MSRCFVTLGILASLGGMTAYAMHLGLKPEEQLTEHERWMSDTGMGLLAGALLIFWFSVGVIAYLRRRRREREAWAGFAERRGFNHLRAGEGDARIEGERSGRRIVLRTHVTEVRRSGSGSSGGTLQQILSVSLEGVPAGLRASRPLGGGGVFGSMARGMLNAMIPENPHRVRTGDPAFDEGAFIHAAEPESAAAWLTGPRRSAVEALLSETGCSIHDAEGLVWTRSGRSQTEQELAGMLERLEELASAIEG